MYYVPHIRMYDRYICTVVVVHNILYSGFLSREKTFANCLKIDFRGEKTFANLW